MNALLYRIGSMFSRDPLERLGGEASAGEVAQGLRVSPATLENACRACLFGLELRDRVLCRGVVDAVAAQVVADERVAGAAARERSSPIFGEGVVGKEPCLRQALKRRVTFVRCDAGTVEALLELRARVIAMPQRPERHLRRV